ncbi:ABC transporter ATP-binding protein [Arenibacter sp. BSSL-BM3]|uniref:ABC transporter ATP-binding protein n=1 Tax=Arenibacter arenosicollis TaxID=2762274 RepID=A0ABR7QII4_9FLAO|nr:ABC transporter ATP-binding protein [Arenibacter arenosicollis]MBC8766770.1 ABC transporter ATP-binding protein [Arenibacter arenosicollis]
MLQVNSLSFAYDKIPVLTDINFKVAKGEHISIVGESGCGKSTLLKIIYGLLQPNQGDIFWGEKQVLGPDFNLVPGESYMKYLSQDFDLMPFTTVAENVSQFLSVFYPEELKARTAELLEMIDMVPFAKVKVKNLSGGQQQRVALARVLAQKPELLLLDEPFGHIDNFRKNQLRRNLFGYLKKEKISCITATHDYQDILPYANRIIVLKDQEIMVDANTKDLYNNPKNIYTATLFGEANHIPINIIKSYGDVERKIIVYAHEFRISNKSGIPTTVEKCYFMGSHFLIEGLSGENRIRFNSDESIPEGKQVFLNIALETINQRLKP